MKYSYTAPEVCAGQLPDIFHGISGKLCFKDQFTVIIRNFYYDSTGPGTLYTTCTCTYRYTIYYMYMHIQVHYILHVHVHTGTLYTTCTCTYRYTIYYMPHQIYFPCDVSKCVILHTHTHTCTHTHTHIHTHTHMYTHTHTSTHTHTHVHTHTCTHTHTHTHTHTYTHMYTHTYTHIGCAVLLCLVCLFDLAFFFLPSFSSLIKTCTFFYKCTYTHTHIHIPDVFLYWYPTGSDPAYTAANVQTVYRFGRGTTIPHPQSQT